MFVLIRSMEVDRMKIQGAIPPGYVKAMEKKEAKDLNPQAYINQGKINFQY